MLLVDRQVIRFSVKLAGAGKNDLDPGIGLAANLKDTKLCGCVDLEVRLRISHRIQVAGLPGKVEQVILILEQIGHRKRIAHVAHIHRDLVADVLDIVWIAAVLRDQAINQRDLRPLGYQRTGKIGADETQTAGDQDLCVGIGAHARSPTIVDRIAVA